VFSGLHEYGSRRAQAGNRSLPGIPCGAGNLWRADGAKRGSISVAGRKGEENFTCITRVIFAFLRNIGIDPAGEILIDRVDAIRDIRTIAELEENVKGKVKQHLILQKATEK
jgi:hypothetical protein